MKFFRQFIMAFVVFLVSLVISPLRVKKKKGKLLGVILANALMLELQNVFCFQSGFSGV